MSPLITLTTDFGTGSPYVAEMKGVILSINPSARIVDIAHNIGPQNVRQAAILLAEATTWFPAGTIHVAVIDPGVGTERRIIYAQIDDQQYIAPDNGVLSRLMTKTRPARIITLANSEHWLPSVSTTFHGRDIMAPVAAQISLGMEPDRLGPARPDMLDLDWPAPEIEANSVRGQVSWIDGFGNLITNIPTSVLPALAHRGGAIVEIGDRTIQGIGRTYGERPTGAPVALVGSSGFMEVAVVNGSAVTTLGASVGAMVAIHW